MTPNSWLFIMLSGLFASIMAEKLLEMVCIHASVWPVVRVREAKH